MSAVRLNSTQIATLGTGKPDPTQKAHDAAREFEAVFLSQFLQSMGQGLSKDSLFGQEPFGSMLVDQYAKLVAKSGGLGIASSVQKELMRLQETAP